MNQTFRPGMLRCTFATLFLLLSGGLYSVFQEPASGRQSGETPKGNPDATEILETLKVQAGRWNDGDIEGFMQTYWKSDAMTFSSGGTTHIGWQAALDRYRKNYPREKMGKLRFETGPLTMLATDAALLLGNYSLEQDGKISEGNFSLVLRRFPEGWRIIHDHSSSLDTEESATRDDKSNALQQSGVGVEGNQDTVCGV